MLYKIWKHYDGNSSRYIASQCVHEQMVKLWLLLALLHFQCGVLNPDNMSSYAWYLHIMLIVSNMGKWSCRKCTYKWGIRRTWQSWTIFDWGCHNFHLKNRFLYCIFAEFKSTTQGCWHSQTYICSYVFLVRTVNVSHKYFILFVQTNSSPTSPSQLCEHLSSYKN